MVTINASTTSGLVMTSDLSGVLTLQQNGVSLPNGGVAPAFSAYKSASQTGVTSATVTKITFDVESFDTNSNFASSRFTPTVAGYYLINTGVDIGATAMTNAGIYIYKNGTVYHQNANNNTSGDAQINISGIVYCNGTTDYIEIYGIGAGTGVLFYGDNTLRYTWFSGSLVRGA